MSRRREYVAPPGKFFIRAYKAGGGRKRWEWVACIYTWGVKKELLHLWVLMAMAGGYPCMWAVKIQKSLWGGLVRVVDRSIYLD